MTLNVKRYALRILNKSAVLIGKLEKLLTESRLGFMLSETFRDNPNFRKLNVEGIVNQQHVDAPSRGSAW